MSSLRIALAQLNVTVGDIPGNQRLIAGAIRQAQAWLADVVVVPELALTGYPPEDLLLKPQFVQANRRALQRLVKASRGLVAVVGFVDQGSAGGAPRATSRARADGQRPWPGSRGRLSNAAAVLADGRWVATYHKRCLPNYGVFDEKRYFTPGSCPVMVTLGGIRIGLTICEDLWEAWPCRDLARAGCQLVINLSASPYHAGKLTERERLFRARSRANRVAIAYCNVVGGQDELVFDGGSLILDARGRELIRGAQFREDLALFDLLPSHVGRARSGVTAGAIRIAHRLKDRPPLLKRPTSSLTGVEEVYEALTLGLRDYVTKNGFSAAVLGLSGGVDSALTACIAADALGPSHVMGVVMPSRFSSRSTQEDAKQVARALRIEVQDISIEPIFQASLETLKPLFGNRPADLAEQNIQARIRGNLLMALSNKFGWLVLTTGNKSEMATGYTTLYGDMAGGFAVIKDVPKTLVYALANFRNRRGQGVPIPRSILGRAPTAELAPNQRDQDTLPPYDVLDRILKAYVEEDRGLREILATNRVTPDTVRRVIQMVDHAEYKRRQGPPGIKITPKAFGKDRRMPITNRYQQI